MRSAGPASTSGAVGAPGSRSPAHVLAHAHRLQLPSGAGNARAAAAAGAVRGSAHAGGRSAASAELLSAAGRTPGAGSLSPRRGRRIAARGSANTPGGSGGDEDHSGASTSGQGQAGAAAFDKRQLAAMALSPLAALSLPLVYDPAWRASFQAWRASLGEKLGSESFHKWLSGVGEEVTYMEGVGRWTGFDLAQVWDPELWLAFRDAVWHERPAHFWNALMDRINYQKLLPAHGLVGDMRLSYAKLLQLLAERRVKRLVVYGDMHTAVAEVPHPWHASLLGHPSTAATYVGPDGETRLNMIQRNPLAPDDPIEWFCRELPEWDMEKYRFYVDLPGDVWQAGGELMALIKAQQVGVEWDPASGQFVMPYAGLTKVFQVKTELALLDPRQPWDFAGWLLADHRLAWFEKAAAVCVALRLLGLGIALASGAPIFKLLKGKKKKKDKKESAWERLTSSRARQFNVKDDKGGKARDTGVRFADIAGMDFLVTEMREVVKMLLGDPQYKKVGARCPRGIIFQGPPGTGKTYLARAIAGEAGVAFFSAVGSEFVEMFAGVAAARVNSLFYNARKKGPAIIFIDEIDAIGRARSMSGGDPGSQERESALLALLVQMDGIHGNTEAVLTIGATNLAQELDAALLRPGRFEVVYEIGQPGPESRLEILKYHSRNKPLEGGQGGDMLVRVAEVTSGFSAAGLANLMNEAAILTVRRGVPRITLPMVLELVEGINWGVRATPLPPSAAKERLAAITAAKAVAFALCPSVDEISAVSLWSGKRGLGPTIDFIPSEESLRPDIHPEEIELLAWKKHYKVNAAAVGGEALGEFAQLCSLLTPLYAPRAAEVVLYGPDQASLASAPPLADAFGLAYYAVRNSGVHPRFKSMPPLHTWMYMGEDAAWRERRDPLAVGFDEELGYHKLALTLLKAAWKRSLRLVHERRSAILAVADALMAKEDERLTGAELVALVESSPLDEVTPPELAQLGADFLPLLKTVLGRVPNIILTGASGEDDTGTAGAAAAAAAASGSAAGTAVGQAAQASWRVAGAGSLGMLSFHGPPSGPPLLRVNDESLRLLAGAVMGRLDVVDLVGRATAEEAAERVRDALLHPATVDRLKAVRRWADDVANGAAPFPPGPLEADALAAISPGGPLYGSLALDLSWWKRTTRPASGPGSGVISWSAMEMLMTERQRRYFAPDADLPRPEDTSAGRKAAAAAAAGAGAKAAPGAALPAGGKQ